MRLQKTLDRILPFLSWEEIGGIHGGEVVTARLEPLTEANPDRWFLFEVRRLKGSSSAFLNVSACSYQKGITSRLFVNVACHEDLSSSFEALGLDLEGITQHELILWCVDMLEKDLETLQEMAIHWRY